ncbi:hypothetical protein EON64_03035 [archaeon]|nr:MAG: hypothetical protein EON64_03035 [archaeon]
MLKTTQNGSGSSAPNPKSTRFVRVLATGENKFKAFVPPMKVGVDKWDEPKACDTAVGVGVGVRVEVAGGGNVGIGRKRLGGPLSRAPKVAQLVDLVGDEEY